MSVLDKDGVIVLGSDTVNPQNNITIKTPAIADGSLEIYKGVPGALGTKLFEVGETGANFTNLFGVGQTWQNVTASRSFWVTYTNNTSRPILVAVSAALRDDCLIRVYVNGRQVSVAQDAGEHRHTAAAVVPVGETYVYGTQFGTYAELEISEFRD